MRLGCFECVCGVAEEGSVWYSSFSFSLSLSLSEIVSTTSERARGSGWQDSSLVAIALPVSEGLKSGDWGGVGELDVDVEDGD